MVYAETVKLVFSVVFEIGCPGVGLGYLLLAARSPSQRAVFRAAGWHVEDGRLAS